MTAGGGVAVTCPQSDVFTPEKRLFLRQDGGKFGGMHHERKNVMFWPPDVAATTTIKVGALLLVTSYGACCLTLGAVVH